jgi:AcrR family transcriptional regulator
VSTLESSYHHGSLRSALVDAALTAIEGAEGALPSLRELARGVGVSPTAVYRHFPNKEALLAAIGSEGVRMLGEAQQAAYDKAGGGSAGFAATGRAYVRFALAHPALFRLVFAHGATVPSPMKGSDPASDLLRRTTTELTGGGPAAETLALQAWSIAHGIAMLMLDERLPPDPALIDRLLDTESLFPLQSSRSDESP